jgi:hypothetical protein
MLLLIVANECFILWFGNTFHSNWHCLTLSFVDNLDAFKQEWSRLRQTPKYPAIDKEPKPDYLSIFDQFFK